MLYADKVTDLARRIDYVPCSSEREALLWERRLIRRYQPFFNSIWKDDKSYPYVKITLEEEFPRFVLTRKRPRRWNKRQSTRRPAPRGRAGSALETLGLEIDPVNQRLKPATLFLAAA